MERDGLLRTLLSGSVMCKVPSKLYNILHNAYVEGTRIDTTHPIFHFPCSFVVIDEVKDVLPNGIVAHFELRDLS
jgi:hypothetical protein